MPKKKHNDKKKPTVWEVLNKYADIRDEFDNVLESYGFLQFELSAAMHDISKDLDQIRNELTECDRIFKRYRVQKPASFFSEDIASPEDNLPFA